jgi:hypothetical protein
MPSPMTIKIECEPYLKEFMQAIFGPEPISFPRNHVLNYTIRHLLDRPPRDYVEQKDYETYVEIALPYCEETNVIYNFYLSEKSKQILRNRMEREFRLAFRDDVNKSRLTGINKKDAVGLFIDKYELNADIIDMLEKDYQRNSSLRSWKNRKLQRKKNIKNTSV